MGRVTDENRRELERALFFEDADLKGMVGNQFPATLGRLIKQKKISVLTIVENTNVSKSYINKLRNPDEKNVNPSRRVVIDIALAINATLEETNMLLKRSGRYVQRQVERIFLSADDYRRRFFKRISDLQNAHAGQGI